jgi:LuxR family maltose regulon positive regulatory protein
MNLFLMPLDDERRWYRYHQLFADVLRDRLLRGAAPAEIETLHRRASRWFEQRNLVAEAIRHALAAQDWDQAARLVEHASSAVVLGNMQQHQTLRTWLQALPEQVVRVRPKLCLLRARLAMLTDLEQVAYWVRHAEQAIELVGPAEDVSNTRGEVAALLAGLAASQGAAADAIGYAQQALTDLDTANLGVRGEVMQYLARAYLVQHDAGRAAEAFAQMSSLARTAGDHIASFIPETNLAYLQRLQGKLSLAILTCRRTLDVAAEHGAEAAPDASWVLAGLADLLRERNDLDAALAYARGAAARGKQLAIPNLTLLCSLVLARVHQARGEVAQALAIVGEMRAITEQFRVLPLQGLFRAFEAQLHLQQGDLTSAMALVGEQEPSETDLYWISPILVVYSNEHLAIARAQAQLAHGRATCDQRQLREALGLLGQQQERAEREELPWLRVKLFALQALAEQALGNLPQALRILRRAVELATPEGLMRVLLDEGVPMKLLIADCRSQIAQKARDQSLARTGSLLVYIDKLLAAFPDSRAQVRNEPATNDQSEIHNLQSAMVEPLTARELDVLRLLGSGLSNQAIAQELVVAVGTVKRHIANILSKLQVDSRLAAVAHARELGLL